MLLAQEIDCGMQAAQGAIRNALVEQRGLTQVAAADQHAQPRRTVWTKTWRLKIALPQRQDMGNNGPVVGKIHDGGHKVDGVIVVSLFPAHCSLARSGAYFASGKALVALAPQTA